MNKKNQEPDFMPEVERLQTEINSLKERIELVENNKEKVRPKIYEKVKSDYQEKLDSLFSELEPFKEKIQEEISTIENQISDFKSEIERLEEEMEEIQLRYLAGEYEETNFKPQQEKLQKEIDDKQSVIDNQQEAIVKFKTQLAFITGKALEESADIEEEAEEISEEEHEVEEAEEISEEEHEVEEIEEVQEEKLEFPHEVESIGELEEVSEEEEEEEFQDYAPETQEKEAAAKELDFPMEDIDETAAGDEEYYREAVAEVSEDEGQGDEYIWNCTPVLDVIEGDFAGESYPMDKDRITIGRGPNNDIQLATDTSVSRHHAQLSKESNRYVVVDLESSNGTSVNGIRISRTYLRPNDEIMIGQSKLVVRPSKD